jgi:phosphoribosylformylglycinamidine cyclo-ligase
VLKLLEQGIKVRGMSHITGGGIPGNLPRCFPKKLGAVVDVASWRQPEIFNWLQQTGGVAQDEMYRVFNCGIGFVIVVPRLQADDAMASLKKSGAKPWFLGEVTKGSQDVRFA